MSVVTPVARRRLARTVTIGVPSILAVVLALTAGALQIVNNIVLASDPQWKIVVALVLATLAGFGVQPLVGAPFARTIANLLHLPYGALFSIAAAIVALSGVVQALPISDTAHAVVLTVLTVLNALGFGTASASPAVLTPGLNVTPGPTPSPPAPQTPQAPVTPGPTPSPPAPAPPA